MDLIRFGVRQSGTLLSQTARRYRPLLICIFYIHYLRRFLRDVDPRQEWPRIGSKFRKGEKSFNKLLMISNDSYIWDLF